MRVVGEWLLCDDGVTRPVIRAKVAGADGQLYPERFLLDLGADRTVFSAGLLSDLQVLGNHHPPGMTLQGISGSAPFVLLTSVIEFTRDDGGPARVRGEFAAFTDPRSADMSVLGRDVLNNFDVIASRPCNEILLLAPNHHYQVVQRV
jgi:hypothetical protein